MPHNEPLNRFVNQLIETSYLKYNFHIRIKFLGFMGLFEHSKTFWCKPDIVAGNFNCKLFTHYTFDNFLTTLH